MKTLIIFYSYGGATKKLAEELAARRGADLVEVKDQKRPGKIGTFLRCPAAMGQKPGKIQPVSANFAAYQRFVVMGPVWASHPAPPVNNIFQMLPKGSEVEIIMVSGGGSSAKDKVVAFAEGKGLKVAEYVDHKSGKSP